MTLDEFATKYSGQRLTDNHGGYQGECVSLAKRYAQEVQGLDGDKVLFAPGSAAKGLFNPSTAIIRQYYDLIPASQPRKRGDLVVWGYGQYGDVAIALDDTTKVFGQLGTPVFNPAGIRQDISQGLLGYLRLKGTEPMVDEGRLQELFVGMLGHEASPHQVSDFVGKPYGDVIDTIYTSPEYKSRLADLEKYRQAFIAQNATVLKPGTYKVN